MSARRWMLPIAALAWIACTAPVGAAHAPVLPPPSVVRASPDGGTRKAPDGRLGSVGRAMAVVRAYYAAIGAKKYRRAFELWADHGAASGQTFSKFVKGFAHTRRVAVELGKPSRIEPAMGSRYIRIPVVIRAVTDGGAHQRFKGTYTLRRGVVEGATPAQRHWHIYSAKISRAK